MAIMKKCLCFSNVRTGSQACGVYSLITSVIYLAVWSFGLAQFVSLVGGNDNDAIKTLRDGIYAAYSINIMVLVFLLIASIVLLVGVSQDNKEMLIPYMVAITALIALQALAWIIIFALLGLGSAQLIVNLVFWLVFTAFNITSLVCVISQYQELRDGRGTSTGA